MAKKKLVTAVITLSVPATMTAYQARREVRHLINEHRNYSADEHEVKVRRVSPMTEAIVAFVRKEGR